VRRSGSSLLGATNEYNKKKQFNELLFSFFILCWDFPKIKDHRASLGDPLF